MNKFAQNKIFFSRTVVSIFVVAGFLLFSIPATATENSYPIITIEMQAVLQKKITLAVKDKKLNDVLLLIQKQSGVGFAFNKGIDINNLPNISITAKNQTVAEVLEQMFANIFYVYRIIADEIIISIKPQAVVKKGDLVRLTGKIIDDANTPVTGAVILIEGTTKGAISNEDGSFSFIVNIGDVLEASFVGHKPIKYNVTGGNLKLTLKLERTNIGINDVIVTGYQRIDKRYNTSAVTSLKASDIITGGITSLDKALEGRVPEMLFMSNSGEVGATPRLRIRGTSTLLGNREPLWVLDGFVLQDPVDVSNDDLNNPDYINIIGNAIAGINPQDIERIDILKDASATALYGTRAANGVIVVTTKKGAISKPTISYNHSSKIIQRPSYTDRNIVLMNSQERVQFGKDLTDLHYSFPSNMPLVGYEGAFYRHQTGVTSYNEFQDEVRWYENVNTDWFGLLTQTNYSHDHTVSISGGTEDIRYYASVGYNRENSVTKDVFTNRFTGRINLTGTLIKKVQFNLSLSGNAQDKKHLADELNAIDYAYNTTRALPSHNADGSLFNYDAIKYKIDDVKQIPYAYNILNEMENSSSEYKGNAINMSIDLRYQPINDLTISVAGSYNRSSTLQDKWLGEKSHYVTRMRNSDYGMTPPINDAGNSIIPYGGIQKLSNTIGESYTFRTQVDYLTFIGSDSKHRIDASGGFEAYSTESSGINDLAYGYFKERGMKYVSNVDLELYPHYKAWLNSGNGRSRSNNLTRTVSGYMTLTYSFKNYFSINANGRFDISNKFGDRSNDRFLPIWSISGMVNLKNILLPESEVLSELTLRSSLGLQGNMLDDQSPDFIVSMDAINTDYNENTSRVGRLPNPNLRWEKTRQINIGLDAAFFNNRFSIGGSFYNKLTNECFSVVTVPAVNGVTSFVMNDGTLRNIGYSVSLRGEPIRTTDWRWTLGMSFSGNKNNVKTENKNTYTYNTYLTGNAIVAGEAISTFYSYNFLGLNPMIGIPMFNDYEDKQHLLENKTLQETIMATMVNSGTREPKFQGSFSSGVTYKRLSFAMMFSAGFGSKVRLFPLYGPVLNGVSAENNVRKEFTNRWQVSGDEKKTSVPVILSPSDPNYTKYLQHYSQSVKTTSTENSERSIKQFASSIWNMYDNSHQRVVSGNYLKISSISLNYRLNSELLKNTPLSDISIGFDVRDVYTFSAKELRGQDPMQSGFDKPNLSIRPAYTFNIKLSF